MGPISKPRPDLWGPGAIALALALFLVPRTPVYVSVTGTALFGVLCYIVWNHRWVGEPLWRKCFGITVAAVAVFVICRGGIQQAQPITVVIAPTPAASPLVILDAQVVDKPIPPRPNGSRHIVFAIILYYNTTGNTYAFSSYFTTGLGKTLDNNSAGILLTGMKALNDRRVALGQNPLDNMTIPPYYSGNTTTDSSPATMRYLTPKQYNLFRAGKLAYYFVGTIQAIKGEQVNSVARCGYGVYTFTELVTHSCPYGI
jgi:hypothetical protein